MRRACTASDTTCSPARRCAASARATSVSPRTTFRAPAGRSCACDATAVETTLAASGGRQTIVLPAISPAPIRVTGTAIGEIPVVTRPRWPSGSPGGERSRARSHRTPSSRSARASAAVKPISAWISETSASRSRSIASAHAATTAPRVVRETFRQWSAAAEAAETASATSPPSATANESTSSPFEGFQEPARSPLPSLRTPPIRQVVSSITGAGSTGLELGIGTVEVAPDRVRAVVADLARRLDGLLVDLDSKPRPRRTTERAVDDLERGAVDQVVQERGAEEGDGLLLDEDVRYREVDLKRGGERDRPERAMGCDRDVVHLGHGRDPARLGDASRLRDVRLRDGKAGREHLAK